MRDGRPGAGWTAGETAALCGGEVVGDPGASAWGFVGDSRAARPGTAFVAIRGGHAFVADALARGAPFAVVERAECLPAGATGVVVPAVQAALGVLGAEAGRRLGVPVVGITGSTGKTLTKDLVAAALAPRFAVHASPASFNNEIGFPLALLSCPPGAEVVVLEMGARRPGDVAALCGMARPRVGVVTGIGVAHLEVFGSRPAIARAKGELLQALPPDGVAVLPAGDDFLGFLVSLTPARVVTVGPGGVVRPVAVGVGDDGCTRAELEAWGERLVVRLPVPGRALVRNAALALACAAQLGVPPAEAAQAISSLGAGDLSPWRMAVERAGGRTVVNDAYNANPTSVAAALRAVRELAGGRPAWAVLGVMAELGEVSHAEHVRMGRLAAALGFERVVAVGGEAWGIVEGAGPAGVAVRDGSEAAALVAAEAPAEAVVLVKGSRVAGLEQVAAAVAKAVAG